MTLVEVLTAVSVLAIIVVAMDITDMWQQRTFLNNQSSQNRIANTVLKYSGMAAVIGNSARQMANSELYKCLTQTAPGENDCQNGRIYEVALYGPFVGDGAITGAAAQPIWYTASGSVCTNGNGCVLEVSTTFVPTCPFVLPSLLPTPTCDSAATIEIRYNVRNIVTGQIRTGSISTSVSQIYGF